MITEEMISKWRETMGYADQCQGSELTAISLQENIILKELIREAVILLTQNIHKLSQDDWLSKAKTILGEK